MSYFYVGVGGSGAKLMQALIHLSAAGLLSVDGGSQVLKAFLVDPDKSNGSIDECKRIYDLYNACRPIKLGEKAALLRNDVHLSGPWSPLADDRASMNSEFSYAQLQQVNPVDADLMELLYSEDDRNVSLAQGFRGRPAIGAAVFSQSIDFGTGMWNELYTAAQSAHAFGDVSIFLGGSIFGGSGAAGVPTICRILKEKLQQKIQNLRMGMVLFLPYFTYKKIEDETIQADPAQFSAAAEEALKYYDERQFLDICNAIYAVGDTPPARMPVSAFGAKEQRNPPHYVELIAGLGAFRFFTNGWNKGPQPSDGVHTVSLASRSEENSLTWKDIPAEARPDPRLELLQQFILFAVSYHYFLFPFISTCKDRKHPLRDLIGMTPWNKALSELQAIDSYVVSFLEWLLAICTQDRDGASVFSNGLIDVNVIGEMHDLQYRLKPVGQVHEEKVADLFLNRPECRRPKIRAIFAKSTDFVSDQNIEGAGMLVRAIYEACNASRR